MKSSIDNALEFKTASRKLKRTAVGTALVFSLSLLSNIGVANATPASEAIATIEAYNVLNDATGLTIATLTTAGVTGLVDANLAGY